MSAVDWNKRRIFIREYSKLGNATEAARRAGVPAMSAHAVAYKWLRNPEIVALLKEELDAHIRELGPLAVSVIKEIMLDPGASPQTRLTAARDMLDRLGWVPPKRAEIAPMASAQRSPESLTREELEEIIRRGQQAEQEDAEDEGGGDAQLLFIQPP